MTPEKSIDDMFERMTSEIFEKAGVLKEDFPWAWDQCKDILSAKMASGSVFHGLSYKRVEMFEKQKQTLVEDLIALKGKK